mgnify:CR=1 FL=1
MKLQENILHIVIKNPVKENVPIHNQNVLTSKQNKELHGLGIANMKTIVDKYRGTFDIRCSEQQFILNIVLESMGAVFQTISNMDIPIPAAKYFSSCVDKHWRMRRQHDYNVDKLVFKDFIRRTEDSKRGTGALSVLCTNY